MTGVEFSCGRRKFGLASIVKLQGFNVFSQLQIDMILWWKNVLVIGGRMAWSLIFICDLVDYEIQMEAGLMGIFFNVVMFPFGWGALLPFLIRGRINWSSFYNCISVRSIWYLSYLYLVITFPWFVSSFYGCLALGRGQVLSKKKITSDNYTGYGRKETSSIF